MIAAHPDLNGHRLAAELFGQPGPDYGRSDALAALIGNADERRAQVLTLALVLAACEAHVGKDTWRRDGTTSWHGPYLRFLADHGYTLAEVEVRRQRPNRLTAPIKPRGGTDAESRRRDAVRPGGGLA